MTKDEWCEIIDELAHARNGAMNARNKAHDAKKLAEDAFTMSAGVVKRIDDALTALRKVRRDEQQPKVATSTSRRLCLHRGCDKPRRNPSNLCVVHSLGITKEDT